MFKTLFSTTKASDFDSTMKQLDALDKETARLIKNALALKENMGREVTTIQTRIQALATRLSVYRV